MLYGICSDIHSNATAFEAVLQSMNDNGVERRVCLGDLVGYGADPDGITVHTFSELEDGDIADAPPSPVEKRLLRERLRGAPRRGLPRLLCAYPLRVTGVRGFDQAQVTQGGIDTADFDPATLAHRRLPGLHACGEILNVDGDCGGYNLQFAFITGILAGKCAITNE